MAEKDIDMRELEKQLSCPTGESGLEVAKMMHESNLGMTVNTIDLLEVGDGDFVLELGHGNCAHLELLLKRADDVRYYGLELSEINEIARVLKPDGRAVITSAPREVAEKLPFIGEICSLYT